MLCDQGSLPLGKGVPARAKSKPLPPHPASDLQPALSLVQRIQPLFSVSALLLPTDSDVCLLKTYDIRNSDRQAQTLTLLVC